VKFKQFAALPYRMHDTDLEILFDHHPQEAALVGAQAWPMKRSAPHQTAAIEAYEEAGVYKYCQVRLAL